MMQSAVTLEPTTENDMQIQQAIDEQLAEIARMNEALREEHVKFIASSTRTDAILAEVQTMLSQMRAGNDTKVTV